jgi:putative ATP-binding cassette transporter
MMFMPQRPYLPLGSLRAAISYPAEPGRFDDAAVRAALMRVGLGHLVPALENEQRWDKELPVEEQQRLAFARLLLHQPHWVLIDDAMGALDQEHRQLMLSIFEHELADAAVISIGRSPANDGFYSRILHFRRLSEGAVTVPLRPRLRPAPRVAAFASAEQLGAREVVASGRR